jgi:hypothetical protein
MIYVKENRRRVAFLKPPMIGLALLRKPKIISISTASSPKEIRNAFSRELTPYNLLGDISY